MILKNAKGNETIVQCSCGCGESIEFAFDNDIEFLFLSVLQNKSYAEDMSGFGIFKEKVRRIWSIVTNKTHYLSDLVLNMDDCKEIADFLNSVLQKSGEQNGNQCG